MRADKWISFRVDAETLERLNELGSRFGNRTRFVSLAVGYAEATMTLNGLIADGASLKDAEVRELIADIGGFTAALTPDPQMTENDARLQPGVAKPQTLVGKEVA
jgi:hypothetical protein